MSRRNSSKSSTMSIRWWRTVSTLVVGAERAFKRCFKGVSKFVVLIESQSQLVLNRAMIGLPKGPGNSAKDTCDVQ